MHVFKSDRRKLSNSVLIPVLYDRKLAGKEASDLSQEVLMRIKSLKDIYRSIRGTSDTNKQFKNVKALLKASDKKSWDGPLAWLLIGQMESSSASLGLSIGMNSRQSVINTMDVKGSGLRE